MHIDTNMAAIGGQERPILHGLCSLGFACRHVLEAYAGGDPSLFKSVKVRLSLERTRKRKKICEILWQVFHWFEMRWDGHLIDLTNSILKPVLDGIAYTQNLHNGKYIEYNNNRYWAINGYIWRLVILYNF